VFFPEFGTKGKMRVAIAKLFIIAVVTLCGCAPAVEQRPVGAYGYSFGDGCSVVEFEDQFGAGFKLVALDITIDGDMLVIKGEKRHVKTDKNQLKEMLENLKKYSKSSEIVIINESPYPVEDSVLGLKLSKKA